MAKPLLTLNEAADRLNISRSTMLRWLKAGKIPSAKLGRGWRIDPDDLDRFIDAGKRQGLG